MDPEKAYIWGLLHDIGRKFVVSYLKHVSDGYSYMMSLGHDAILTDEITKAWSGMTTRQYKNYFSTVKEMDENAVSIF